MKMKKALALMLAASMVLGSVGFASANPTTTAAEVPAGLERIVASGAFGVSGLRLEDEARREELTAIVLRLNGISDEEVKALNEPANFSDIASWNMGAWIGKAVKEGFFKGDTGATTFRPNDSAKYAEVLTVLMRALGYTEADFEGLAWPAGYVAKAMEVGLEVEAGIDPLAPVKREVVAYAMEQALDVEVKGGEMTLAQKLGIEEVVEVKELALVSVEATGAKKLTVEFNKAVENADKAVFTVKRASVNVNVAEVKFADDNKSAVIELSSRLIKGDYAVTVTGVSEEALTGTVTGIQDEVATTIDIVSNELASVRESNGMIRTAVGSYKVFNQYGEDITTGAPAINWTSSVGAAPSVDTAAKTFTVSVVDPAFLTIGQPIVVTAVMTNPGIVATKTVNVGNPATVDAVSFETALYNSDDKAQLNTAATYENFVVLFEAKDQYGNKLSANHLNNEFVITSTNPGVVTVASTNPVLAAQGKDANKTGIALVAPSTKIEGTAAIRMISKTTGKAFEYNVTVAKAATVDSITLLAPAKTVATGEKVEIPFEAYDQFGKAVTSFSALDGAGKVNILAQGNGTLKFENDYVNKKAVLYYTAPATKGNYVLMVSTPSGKVSQLSIEVKDAALASVVTGTKDVVTNVAINGSFDLELANLLMIDQWGREIKLTNDKLTDVATDTTVDKYKVVATKVSTDDRINLSGEITDDATAITVTGKKKGNSTVTLKLQKVVDKGATIVEPAERYVFEDVKGSEFALRVMIADKADLVSYEIKELPTILDVDGQVGIDADDYKADFTVYGVTANGTKVVMPADDYHVVTNNEKITHEDGKIAVSGLTGFTSSVREQKKTIVVTVLGTNPVVLTQEVTISNVAPKVTTVALNSKHDNYEAAGLVSVGLPETANELTYDVIKDLVADVLVAKDQYGVELSDEAYTVILSNFTVVSGTARTLKGYNNATDTTLAKGNTFTVTAISDTNVVTAFTVVVK